MTFLFLTVALAGPDLDRLDAALQQAEQAGVLVGEVLVVDGEEEVYRRRFGGAPKGGRYRVGSISKSLTAGTVMTLVQEGALQLDQPVVEVLPELVEMGGEAPVTLRHLMSHTSGFGPMQAGPFGREPSFDELLLTLRTSELLKREAPPGTRHLYSNGGYQILSEVVRRTTGQTFDRSVQARITEPLGMKDTALHEGGNEVQGTVFTPIGRLSAQRMLPGLYPHDARWDLGGDGAFTSTVDDMARWAQGVRDGDLHTPASVEAMTTPVLNDYAFGWVRSGPRVWHNGALSPLGAYGYLRWSFEDERVVVLLNAVDLSSTSVELRVVVERALAGEEVPTVVAQTGPIAWLAVISRLYLPWWVAAGAVGGFAWWARRPGRSRVAVALGGLMALGLSVGALGTSGLLGMAVACAGAVAAAVGPWRSGGPGRPAGWYLWALLASLVAAVGFGWAWLMVLLMSLVEDPWRWTALLAG